MYDPFVMQASGEPQQVLCFKRAFFLGLFLMNYTPVEAEVTEGKLWEVTEGEEGDTLSGVTSWLSS